jgi:hypothetical protein
MKTKLAAIVFLVRIVGVFLPTSKIFAADSMTNSVTGTNEPSPFKIIVTSTKTRVHVGEPFNVALELKNVSSTNQSIGVWSCSWEENWRSSNPNIPILGSIACLQNGVKHISLAPSELFKQKWEDGKEIQMQVLPTVKTNKITFRISFTPSTWGEIYFHDSSGKIVKTNQWWIEDPKNTYLSDEITININPKSVPDWIPW